MISKTYTNVRGSGIFSSLGKKLTKKFTKTVAEKVTKDVFKKAAEDLAKKAIDKAAEEAPKLAEKKAKELVKNRLNKLIESRSKNKVKSTPTEPKKPQPVPIETFIKKTNLDKSKLAPIIIPTIKEKIKKSNFDINNLMSDYLRHYGSGCRGSGLKIV